LGGHADRSASAPRAERPAETYGRSRGRARRRTGCLRPMGPRKERIMKFVDVGGTRISAIGLGCWEFGSKDWGYGNRYAQEVAGELVHTALDLGVNLIDTAEVYAHGVSEAIVGRAISGRRDDVFLA